MAGIFINYRRDDAPGVAGRLFDYLASKFPRQSLFMDVDAMKPGVDFAKQLDSQVSQCRVLLAVIGPHWLDAKDKAGHLRLEGEKDYVRIELASALKRDIPVIPVLVDGAAMPTEEGLPEDLKSLAFRHALELRHTRFNADADAIVHALETVVPRRRVPLVLIGAGIAAVLVIAGGAVAWQKLKAKSAVPQPTAVAVNPPTAPATSAAPTKPATPSTATPAPAAAPVPAPATIIAAGVPLPTGQPIAAAFGAAIPAGLPAGAKFGDLLNNIAFRGSIMSYQKINPDPAVCQASCRANAHCVAWTYTRPRDPDPQAGCSLKAVALPAASDECCTSAIERPPPPELMQPPQIPAGMTGAIAGAELDGGSYRYFGGTDATPEACQSACRADTQCIAWDYARPGAYATDARCFLKNRPSMQVSSPCCIAGYEQHAAASPAAASPPPSSSAAAAARGPFPDENLIGSDYNHLSVASSAECQSACQKDKECLAWTYVHPGVQGADARCWLKNKIPPLTHNTCCTSGIERSAAQ